MTDNFDATLDRGSLPVSAEHELHRQPYESPLLREWGSLLEMTGGALSDLTDANFNGGSGGV
jgi:hypothetical protein